MLKRLAGLAHVPRRFLVGLATLALVLIATNLLPLFESLELTMYDTWFGIRHAKTDKSDDRIVIIGIDDPSIAQIGRWPWNREVHAQLLSHLGEARVVAFDIILSDANKDLPGDDERFAEAIERHGRVILSTHVELFDNQGQVNQSFKRPTKVLLDAVRSGKHKYGGQGTVNTPIGADGIVRANNPVDTDTSGEPYPSLSLAAVMEYMGYKPDQIRAKSFGPVTVGDLTIARDVDGQTLLNYVGPPNSFTTYSFAKVLSGKVDPAEFKDRIVFVGATTPTLKDDFKTPFSKSTQLTALMPGVEVQATTAATYLNGDQFTRSSRNLNIAVTLILGLLILLIAGRLGVVPGAVTTMSVAAGWVLTAWFAWNRSHFWLDVVGPTVGILSVYTVTTVENWLREQADKARVRNLFGRYVSHNVVNELLNNPEMLEMGGKRYAVTILFSDIRGFTSFSETRDPQEVVQRINDYCKEMVEIIYKHGGTLDKYMGDGIMAYFGAPIPQSDHAERAMLCAHEMRVTMKQLHERWTAAGLQTFKIGVGLNSGEVIAGNIGHPERVEYSLIGSAVNLASRLESMTKEYARSEYGGIVFSDNTYQLAPKAVEEYQPTDLGEVEVRGMTHKVRIFTM